MRITTPGREIFQTLNHSWQTNPIEPTEAYVRTKVEFQKLGAHYSRYFGMSITSAGFRRDTGLTLSQAIGQNLELGLDLVDELHNTGQTDATDAIEAVAFGSIPGWEQGHYMKYWFMAMASPELDDKPGVVGLATKFDDDLATELAKIKEFDQKIMDDPHASNEDRLLHHKLHLIAFGRVAAHYASHPITELIQLVDHKRSLGQYVEASFARALDANLLTIALSPDGLPNNPDLDAKLKSLQQLGVEIPTNSDNGLRLIPQ